MNRFVTLSLGDCHDLTARAHLAILAAMAHAPAESEFCVVTDRPDLFGWFGDRLRILAVDAETLRTWRGRHNFFWRVELMAVVHAAAQGPANILYHDSDVFMRRDLADLCAALEEGDVFMHEWEYDVATARRAGKRRLWRLVAGRNIDGSIVAAPCPMWNAGLIAVGAGRHDLLDRAVIILDQLMDDGVKHTLVEQLAITLAFGATGHLREGRPWMDHFWANKDNYAAAIDVQLAQILTRRLDVARAIELVRREPILLPLRVRKRWWSRILVRLAGHGPDRTPIRAEGGNGFAPLPSPSHWTLNSGNGLAVTTRSSNEDGLRANQAACGRSAHEGSAI